MAAEGSRGQQRVAEGRRVAAEGSRGAVYHKPSRNQLQQ